MAFIIIVDDDVQICTLLERVLRNENHEIVTANDGVEGLKLLRQRQPDLLVVDMYMPGMDGIEVIQQVRSEIGDLPIIAMSGGGKIGTLTPLSVARHLRADVLEKPVRPTDFLSAVRTALGQEPRE